MPRQPRKPRTWRHAILRAVTLRGGNPATWVNIVAGMPSPACDGMGDTRLTCLPSILILCPHGNLQLVLDRFTIARHAHAVHLTLPWLVR